MRPTWAEIDLECVAHNMREVRRLTRASALVTAVIKADGYGHGAVQIGRTLIENGADRFAVATLSEAVELRRAYPDTPIMVLGYTPDCDVDVALEAHIILTVFTEAQAQAFSRAAVDSGQRLTVHLKVDTGMRRLGFSADEQGNAAIERVVRLSGLCAEGIFTHFACADASDKAFTYLQIKRFNATLDALKKRGVTFKLRHAANSAALMDLPETHYDMVRAGIMLYGLYPSDAVCTERANLRPAMRLMTCVAQVRTVEAGDGISYGLIYKAQAPMRVATLPIGYADGFTRMLTGKASGVMNGVQCPVVGRICMDQCMLDVSAVPGPVSVGDSVMLFGAPPLTADAYAKRLGTIHYEVVCTVGKRVPRVYRRGGVIERVCDGLLDCAQKS